MIRGSLVLYPSSAEKNTRHIIFKKAKKSKKQIKTRRGGGGGGIIGKEKHRGSELKRDRGIRKEKKEEHKKQGLRERTGKER